MGAYPWWKRAPLFPVSGLMIPAFAYIEPEELVAFFPKSLLCLTARNACNVGSDASFHAWAWSSMVRIPALSSHTRDRFEVFTTSRCRGKMSWSLSTNHGSHIFIAPRASSWFGPVQSVMEAHSRPSRSSGNELFQVAQLGARNQCCGEDRRRQGLWNSDTHILCPMALLLGTWEMFRLRPDGTNQGRHLGLWHLGGG